MSVRFGGTVADFTISPSSGAPLGGAAFAVYTDTALTAPATLADIGGSAIGNVVTSRASGVFVFDAPNGTTVLYVSDGAGGYIALTPRPDLAYARVVGGVVVGPDGTPVTGAGGSPRVPRTLELGFHGDSIPTGKGQAQNAKWGLNVAARLGGLTYTSYGQGGQTSSETALRFGALDLTTDASVTVPAGTTPVPVTFAEFGDWYPSTYTFLSTLGGIPGTLSHDDTQELRPTGTATDPDTGATVSITNKLKPGWTFARTTAGVATTLPAGTKAHCTETDGHLGGYVFVMCGTNNYNASASNGLGTYVIRDLDLIVQRLEGAGSRDYKICGTHIRPGDGAAPQRIVNKQINNAIGALRYGSHWIDWQGFLLGPGLAFEGLTPTTTDLARMALGQCPPSLMDPDGTHPANPQGWDILTELVVQAFSQTGNVAGAKPVVAQALATSAAPTLSNATTSSVTVTPDPNVTAHGRHVQYRRSAIPATVYDGPNTLGSAVDITALDAGTSYDVRTVPTTILGYGTPSPWATLATTGTAPVALASDTFNSANTANITGRTLDNGANGGGSAGGSGTRVWTTSNTFLGITNNAATESTVAARQTVALVDVGVAYARSVHGPITAMPAVGSNTNVYVRASATVTGNTAVINSYIALQISGDGTARINKLDGTTALAALASVPSGTAQVGDVWEIRAAANAGNSAITDITVIRNGTVVMTAQDSTVPAGTKVGFQLSTAAAIDQFVAYDK